MDSRVQVTGVLLQLGTVKALENSPIIYSERGHTLVPRGREVGDMGKKF